MSLTPFKAKSLKDKHEELKALKEKEIAVEEEIQVEEEKAKKAKVVKK